MTKFACIFAVGVGALLFTSSTPAEAQHRMTRNSRGVDMRCDAGRRVCTFHNIRDRDRHCTWSVSYVVHGRRGRQALSRSGNLMVSPRGRRTASFHIGRGDVRRIQDATLLCRHRRHW